MKIQMVEYQIHWATWFDDEKRLLMGRLNAPGLVIEHIGSTSVPQLSAKPIIDLMIGVKDFSIADQLVPAIVLLDYHYIHEYEKYLPDRRYFEKRNDQGDTHHIHLVEIGSDFWNRLLLFRDYLRVNAQARLEYEKIKKALALLEWKDVNEYATAKTDFVRKTEQEAKAFFNQTG